MQQKIISPVIFDRKSLRSAFEHDQTRTVKLAAACGVDFRKKISVSDGSFCPYDFISSPEYLNLEIKAYVERKVRDSKETEEIINDLKSEDDQKAIEKLEAILESISITLLEEITKHAIYYERYDFVRWLVVDIGLATGTDSDTDRKISSKLMDLVFLFMLVAPEDSKWEDEALVTDEHDLESEMAQELLAAEDFSGLLEEKEDSEIAEQAPRARDIVKCFKSRAQTSIIKIFESKKDQDVFIGVWGSAASRACSSGLIDVLNWLYEHTKVQPHTDFCNIEIAVKHFIETVHEGTIEEDFEQAIKAFELLDVVKLLVGKRSDFDNKKSDLLGSVKNTLREVVNAKCKSVLISQGEGGHDQKYIGKEKERLEELRNLCGALLEAIFRGGAASFFRYCCPTAIVAPVAGNSPAP